MCVCVCDHKLGNSEHTSRIMIQPYGLSASTWMNVGRYMDHSIRPLALIIACVSRML